MGIDYVYSSTDESVTQQLSKGPDVLFGSGTFVGHKALKTAASYGIYVIGVDGDEWVSTFENGQADGANMVLTSAMKKIDVATRTSLMDGLSNSFRGRNVLLGIKEDALALADCHDACSVYTTALQAQTAGIVNDLSRNALDTGVNRVTGQLMISLEPPPPPYQVLGLFPQRPLEQIYGTQRLFPEGSYYDQVYQTLKSLCTTATGCKLSAKALREGGYSPTTEYVTQSLRDYADTGSYDHVIMAGEIFGDAVKAVAANYPSMRFSVIDNVFSPPIQNVEGIIYRDDQVGYLAGVVACEVALDRSQSSASVAVVAGPEDKVTRKRVNGFRSGCKSVCSDCDIDYVYSSTDESVTQQLSKGPDVLFGSGTFVGHKALKTAASYGIYVIGVDGDEWVSTFENGQADGAKMVLTSAMKKIDVATRTSL